MIEKLKKSKKGFTLVELIVVIAIIGVLAAVLVPQYIQYIEKSKEGADINTLGEILHAAEIIAAEGKTSPFTITFATDGKVTTTATDIKSIVPSAKLNSADGKTLNGTATIKVDDNGKVGWSDGTNVLSTEAAFPGINNGEKDSEKENPTFAATGVVVTGETGKTGETGETGGNGGNGETK